MIKHDCIFCKIAAGQSQSRIIYEDEKAIAFHDMYPQAPVHALVIPKEHFDSIKSVTDDTLLGHLFTAAKKAAEKLGINDYRLVVNTGSKSGQTVFHLHIHILGGRYMTWPPG